MRWFRSVGLLVVMVVTGALAGCGGDSPRPLEAGATAVVIAAHANAVPVTADGFPALNDLVAQSAHRVDLVSVVTSDGQPQVSITEQLRNTGQNETTQARQDATNVRAVLTWVCSAAAQVGQANPLQSIAKAADTLHAATGPGPRVLIVLDPGLQTLPPLRFQDGLLNPGTDPAQIAAFVQSLDAVPDLTGIQVVWFGLGQTTAPQDGLTTPAKRQLENIWRQVLTLGNPASLTFNPAGLPTATDTDTDRPALPDVATVPVPELGSPSGTSTGDSPQPPAPLTVPFTADGLGFLADQATLSDPARAAALVTDTAHRLTTGGYTSITITGTTADVGDLAGQLQLGLARAMVGRDLLVRAGVPADRITSVTGVGSRFAGFIQDHNPDGTLNEELAQQNRLVIVSAQ